MNSGEMVNSHFTSIHDDNPDIDRAVAELRVYPGAMGPGEVSKRLGVAPTETLTIGQPVKPESERRANCNGWFLTSEGRVGSKDIRRHLDWLIDELRPAREALLALQKEPNVRMFVFCAIWTNGQGGAATLWPEHMRALADLNLECSFEFADYGEPDE